jgi:hypothetical protein
VTAGTTAVLPHGVWRDGRHVGELGLRALDGGDEAFLLGLPASSPIVERIDALLARCIGDGGANAHDLVRALPVGDRDALALQLRKISIGPALDAVLRCPATGCGDTLELELVVDDVLVPPRDDATETYALTLHDGDVAYAVTVRLVSAGDQEIAARTVAADPDAAVRLLLRACVASASCDGVALDAGALPPRVVDQLGQALSVLDRQAEIELDLVCPSCGCASSAQLDASAYVAAELEQRLSGLYAQIHTIARAYHWDERQILALPSERRVRYLALIAADGVRA